MKFVYAFVFILSLLDVAFSWGKSSERVKLKNVDVLTLYQGRMTSGRRTSPVPQLKCVGGSAGCNAVTPKVVQCYNRGSDGTDFQWECRADMDKAYRFGRVEVSCEGYDYPNDAYILKGSCGLSYTLDLTKDGSGQQQFYGTDQHRKGKSDNSIVVFLAAGVILYLIYKTCLSNNRSGGSDSRPDSSGYPSAPPPPYDAPSAPPPPGFKSTYTNNDYTDSSSRPSPSSGGGFWSGAATGGFLGYLFGSRNSGSYTQRPTTTYDNFGGTTTTHRRHSGSDSNGSSSSGTRTSSGFGGTSRR